MNPISVDYQDLEAEFYKRSIDLGKKMERLLKSACLDLKKKK